MHRIWLLLLASPEINYASKEETECGNIFCLHDHVRVCGARGGGAGEVSFKLFQDQCALQKYGCQEDKTKGFRLVSIKYCDHVLSLDIPESHDSLQNYASIKKTHIAVVEENTINNTFTQSCIQCDCNAKSKTICAIRPNGARFVVKWFADECHMLRHNCEMNLHFSVTDDYICIGDKNPLKKYSISKRSNTMAPAIVDEGLNNEKLSGATITDSQYPECVRWNCISNSKVVCAIRPENERFIIRWFDDECQMLQYNCEKRVSFAVTDDVICNGRNQVIENYELKEETTETDGTTETIDTTETSEREYDTTEYTRVLSAELDFDGTPVRSNFPKHLVVTTVDIRDNINKTVENFFAASHLTGIHLQRLDPETRRMIVENMGPINVFVPRAFVPGNYTPVEVRNETEQQQYAPLAKYCYHRCPKKCPDFYRPVCGARIDKQKMTPFLFFKNHCYMDIAKCMMQWAGYKQKNFTEFEEMGFVFCGGYKLMNTMYMYPLVRILQKMGRLKKKGKVHFVMKNLGRRDAPLQG